MARYKQIIRTTGTTEAKLRFVDEIVSRDIGHPEKKWDHRELEVAHQKLTMVCEGLEQISQHVRFKGSVGTSHFLILVRYIHRQPLGLAGDDLEYTTPPTRIWVKHQIGSWQTHWERLQYDGKTFARIHHRMESHD
jgi:hypothetical protein